jgi:hypothetical protein
MLAKPTIDRFTIRLSNSATRPIPLPNMLDSIITSKTRLRLLVKFFVNSQNTGYLRNLASEFGESTNGIRQELNHLEKAMLISSETVQNKKVYKANTAHPFFKEINHLLLKYVGIEQILDDVVNRVGDLDEAYIINDFALGKPGKILDLVLVGNTFNLDYVNQLIAKTEANLSFRIRYVTLTPGEVDAYLPDKTRALKVY